MIELATIAYLAGIALALLSVDSYFNTDTARVMVHVHPGAQPAGYSEVIAARVIDHELRRIFEENSIARIPNIRIQSENSLITTIAKAARVEQLQAGMQHFLRLDPLIINVVIYPAPSSETAVVLHSFGSRPSGSVFDIMVPGVIGDTRASLHSLAIEIALTVDPYHAQLHQFREITSDAAMARYRSGYTPYLHDDQRQAILNFERRLSMVLETTNPEDAVRVASQFNLLGVVRWWGGDMAGAEAAFRRSHDLDTGLAAATLNLSWVLLARGNALQGSSALQAARHSLNSNPSAARETLSSIHWATTALYAQHGGRYVAAQQAWNESCGQGARPEINAIYLRFRSAATPPASRCLRHSLLPQQLQNFYKMKELLATELIMFAPQIRRD